MSVIGKEKVLGGRLHYTSGRFETDSDRYGPSFGGMARFEGGLSVMGLLNTNRRLDTEKFAVSKIAA